MPSETTLVTPPARAAASGPRAAFLALALLSMAHMTIDLYSAALGALQPLLVAKLGFSLTEAGILGGLLLFSSSVMQPLYGYLSDRFHTRLFTVLSPALAGVFISSLGLAPAYGWLVPLVVLGGVGVAAFHPQASSMASAMAVAGRGRWMAVFISSGMLGFALGPVYFSAVTSRAGLDRMYWAAIPGILVTLLLALLLRPEQAGHARKRTRFEVAALRAIWKPLLILYVLVVIRSVVQVTFAQFLTLYLTRERGLAVGMASYALSVYLASGALGGFIGGNMADRFGGRRVIQVSMVGCVPFLACFFLLSGPASMACLGLGGLMLLFTNPVNIVMAQELAPAESGTVSALMMGFAWGMAGLVFIPLTGWLADRFTLHQVLSTLALLPVAGFLLTLMLPRERAAGVS